MKKRIAIISSVIIIFLALIVAAIPLLARVALCKHYFINTIEEYNPANSSVELCSYLTVRDESNYTASSVLFVDQIKYEESYYLYDYNYIFDVYKETVLLSLKYNNENYLIAYENIINQKGFSKEISFDYYSFSIYLNETELIVDKPSHFTKYSNTDTKKYINWINLVGFSNSKSQIVFLGFYYEKTSGSFITGYSYSYYSFDTWNAFLDKEFSFFEWDK